MGSMQEFKVVSKTVKYLKYDLDLTCYTNDFCFVSGEFVLKVSRIVTFLDMDLCIQKNTIHTKEHHKETSAFSFLPVQTVHDKHAFCSIVIIQSCR